MVKEEKQLPAIVVNSQYVKDLSLEIPHAPDIFQELKSNPEIKLDVEVNGKHLKDNLFNAELHFTVEGKIGKKHLFILELVYGCVAQLNVPQEHIEPVLMIEIPRTIFPYARSIISHNMMEAGLPPFMINPIDFVALYQANKQAAEAPKN